MKHKSDAGFTLLEILVAVTILAITFTALFRLYGGTLRSLENSEKYVRATVLAERKMGEVLATKPLPAAGDQGTFDGNPGYTYHTDIAEYREPIGRIGMAQDTLDRVVTRKIGVGVSWHEEGTERGILLETLKTTVEENR